MPKNIVDRIKILTDNFLEFFIEKYYDFEEARLLPSALTPAFRELFPMPAPMSKQMPMPTSMPQLNPMPMPTPQPAPESGLPPKNNYVAVVTWLQQEKAEGRDYFQEAGKNRAKMCRNLSEIFNWEVDANSLGKRLNPRK